MTRTDTKFHVAALAVAMLVAACAATPPPRGELAAAETAIARAGDAGAAQHAARPLDAATRQLAAARSAFDERDYGRAAQFAEQAQVNAELAAARARAAELRARVQQRTEENTALRRDLLGEGRR